MRSLFDACAIGNLARNNPSVSSATCEGMAAMNAYWKSPGLALLLALCLAGCGGDNTGAKTAPQNNQEGYHHENDPLVNPPFIFESFPEHDPGAADENATLIRHVIDEPTCLNPIFPNSWADGYLRGLLFPSLMRRRQDMVLGWNDERVEHHENSPDNLITTVRLRPGLTWHDGQPWTAHDIRFTWEVINDDQVPAVSFKITAGQIADIRVIDDRTMQFVHKQASPTYMMNMGFPIIPKHILGIPEERAKDPSLKLSDYYARFNRYAPVGAGPYRFVEWITNDRFIVDRWEDYPLKKPHFKRQIIKIQPDRNVSLLLFKKGQLDDIWLTVQQFATQTNDAEFERIGAKGYGIRRMFGYIFWNMDGSNPFFTDRNVRRAMAHAYDRERILREVSYNLYLPSNGIFDTEHWAYNPDVKPIDYDLEKAAQLLDQAGWLVSDEDGWRYKDIQGTPVKFEFTMTFPTTYADARRMANIFRADLRKIGVSFKNRNLENATFSAKQLEHDFHAAVGTNGFSIDPDYWRNTFHSAQYDNGRNYGFYKNDRVDELFALEFTEFDREKRKAYFQEIQKLVYEDQPMLFLWNYTLTYGFNRRLRGIQLAPSGVYFFYPGQFGWWTPKQAE